VVNRKELRIVVNEETMVAMMECCERDRVVDSGDGGDRGGADGG